MMSSSPTLTMVKGELLRVPIKRESAMTAVERKTSWTIQRSPRRAPVKGERDRPVWRLVAMIWILGLRFLCLEV